MVVKKEEIFKILIHKKVLPHLFKDHGEREIRKIPRENLTYVSVLIWDYIPKTHMPRLSTITFFFSWLSKKYLLFSKILRCCKFQVYWNLLGKKLQWSRERSFGIFTQSYIFFLITFRKVVICWWNLQIPFKLHRLRL